MERKKRAEVVVTATYRPVACHRCGAEIATMIMARTPSNPRRRLIKVNTAAIVDAVGNRYCADCGPVALEEIAQVEARLALDVASRVYSIDPTYKPAEADASAAEGAAAIPDRADQRRKPKPRPAKRAHLNGSPTPAHFVRQRSVPGSMYPHERILVRHNGKIVEPEGLDRSNGREGGGEG